MTRDMPTEEAVAVLTDFLMTFGHEKRYDDAFSIAIEALEAEPIVRCKDCKNCGDNAGEPEPYFLYCFEWLSEVDRNGYCYKAERKNEVDNG